jgi:Endodeoxyribonuclease RusA
VKRKFVLKDLKPLSINSTYHRTHHGVVKTQDARDWTYTIFHILSATENQEKLKELREFFDPSKHVFRVEIKALYPRAKLWRKGGGISAKSIDITNFEKSIVDIFWLPRNFQMCSNLNADDKYITEMRSSKVASEDDTSSIEVEIEILEFNV